MKVKTFRDKEKDRYEKIKGELFSEEARQNGFYKRIRRSFCLTDDYSYENLYQGIRDSAMISWGGDATEYILTNRKKYRPSSSSDIHNVMDHLSRLCAEPEALGAYQRNGLSG